MSELEELDGTRAERDIKIVAQAQLRLIKGGTAHTDESREASAKLVTTVSDLTVSNAWRKKLTRENGKVICNQANAVTWCEHCPAMQGSIWFDEFASGLVVRGVIPAHANASPAPSPYRVLTDEDYTAITKLAQESGLKKISREAMINAVQLYVRQHYRFNPVKDYLEPLKWDGHSRFGLFWIVYFGARGQEGDDSRMTAEQAEYLHSVARFLMVSSVARIYHPGCKVDTMPILEGGQGAKKSSGLRQLFAPWFSDNMPAEFTSKDGMQHLQGHWCIELSELPQLRKSEVDTVKNFLSRQEDKYRPAYGRETREFKRQCVFVGSTNEEHYLKDTTGNRRFWPVRCGRVNLKLIAMHRDQLWAEAVHRYKAGESWWFEGNAQRFATIVANDRVAPDPWVTKVVQVLEHSIGDEEFSPGEVLEQIGVDVAQRTPQHAARLATVLKGLGCRKIRRHKTRGQLYIRPDDIAGPADKIDVQS